MSPVAQIACQPRLRGKAGLAELAARPLAGAWCPEPDTARILVIPPLAGAVCRAKQQFVASLIVFKSLEIDTARRR
jgi:hypothetical protein